MDRNVLIGAALLVLVVVIAAAAYYIHHKKAAAVAPAPAPVPPKPTPVPPAPMPSPVPPPVVVTTLSGFNYNWCDGSYVLQSNDGSTAVYSKLNDNGTPRTLKVTGSQAACYNQWNNLLGTRTIVPASTALSHITGTYVHFD